MQITSQDLYPGYDLTIEDLYAMPIWACKILTRMSILDTGRHPELQCL
jgi:hypothetical protein